MAVKKMSMTLRALSHLLTYPDAELRAHLEEVIDLLRDGADPEQLAPQAHALEHSERPKG